MRTGSYFDDIDVTEEITGYMTIGASRNKFMPPYLKYGFVLGFCRANYKYITSFHFLVECAWGLSVITDDFLSV